MNQLRFNDGFKLGFLSLEQTFRLDLLKSAGHQGQKVYYTFLKETMARDEIDEVSIGLQSLQPGGESLDLFKRGMGFEERPIGQRIECYVLAQNDLNNLFYPYCYSTAI